MVDEWSEDIHLRTVFDRWSGPLIHRAARRQACGRIDGDSTASHDVESAISVGPDLANTPRNPRGQAGEAVSDLGRRTPTIRPANTKSVGGIADPTGSPMASSGK